MSNAREAHKRLLLDKISFCEKRIREFKSKQADLPVYDGESSDSDSGYLEIPEPPVSRLELIRKQSELMVRLQATQELTSLQVVEYEVNVMVEPLPAENCKIPIGDGLWREVATECRVDLVPFSMTFYVFQPNCKFPALSYHGLKVSPSKKVHETELVGSVLDTVRNPSDVVQVIKSYAIAYRSRRTSLSRLADRYSNSLFMETLPEGGFILKCANVLEICWTLVNKWSPIAPFHHKLKFELEYMDESYIRQIKGYHKQLQDPTIETNERTAMLTKIIETCLKVSGEMSNVEDSGTDNERMNKTKTTIDQEPDYNEINYNQNENFESTKNLQNIMENMSQFPNVQKSKHIKARIDTKNNDKQLNSNDKIDQQSKAKGDTKIISKKQNNDKEIMAPPKQLPKKVKKSVNKIDDNSKNDNNTKTNLKRPLDDAETKSVNKQSKVQTVTKKAKSDNQTNKAVSNKEVAKTDKKPAAVNNKVNSNKVDINKDSTKTLNKDKPIANKEIKNATNLQPKDKALKTNTKAPETKKDKSNEVSTKNVTKNKENTNKVLSYKDFTKPLTPKEKVNSKQSLAKQVLTKNTKIPLKVNKQPAIVPNTNTINSNNQQKLAKMSKIPQKATISSNEKRNPLKITPRKTITQVKSSQGLTNIKKPDSGLRNNPRL